MTTSKIKKSDVTYEKAGVSIQRGNDWVTVIKSLAAKYYPEQAQNPNLIGGFAGLYPLGNGQYLAACTDGVGSKLILGKKLNLVSGLGQDLVAMNLNDLVTVGAKPLFFLDYIACETLDHRFFSKIMESIFSSCASCGCLVLGGETAEIPQLYKHGEFDLAGFCVGLLHEEQLSAGKSVQSGDTLIGLPSSGFHSNGYTLINQILNDNQIDADMLLNDGHSLAESMMQPTRLYINQALKLWSEKKIKAMAHITGGGLQENIERVLKGKKARLNFSNIPHLTLYDWLSQYIRENEMRKVFNLGIGFVIVCGEDNAQHNLELLRQMNESPVIIGKVE